MKKIAIVSAGCGHQDGTELTEVISLWVALSKLGVQVQFFAPNIEYHPQNHLDGTRDKSQTRNTLIEAARFARGNVKNITALNAKDYDAVAFPGGYGAAQVLSDWAQKGSACDVHLEAKRVILDFHHYNKPIGAICIAPVLLAKVLGDKNITITLGSDARTIVEVQKTGAIHELCPADDFITDRDFKIVTTPAYMYDEAKPHEVFAGISKLAKELVEMA